MRYLITIRGNACSGKTSLARELQMRLGHGTMRISQDSIRRHILHVKDEPNPKSIPLMKLLLDYGQEHAEVVILEGILKADWYAPLFDYCNELYGDHILSYYYDLPFEETQRRRDMKPDRDLLPDYKLHLWWSDHDYAPQWKERILDENVELTDIADEIETAVRNLLKQG